MLPQWSLVLLSALSLSLLLPAASGYCWQAGYNPDFKDKPVVEQVKIDMVRVSWKDIVINRECADQGRKEERKGSRRKGSRVQVQ